MRISLVNRELVDKLGLEFRLAEDTIALKLPYSHEPPKGFSDCGIVEYNGMEFYMATYTPPIVEVDDAE